MDKKAAVIGVFDGVHRGHVTLIGSLVSEARKRKLDTLALTFSPPPSLYFNPNFNFLLSTDEEKKALLLSLGIKEVVFLDFARAVGTEPEDFISDELLARNIRLIVVGEGFRFGYKRRGNIEMLTKVEGLEVKSLSKETIENEPISATRIRELLLLGHIRSANILLGYEYMLSGRRTRGLGRAGALLDTPTINIQPSSVHKLLPPDGIYAVRFAEDRLAGVCYIGSSPTFGDSTHKVEVHLLDGPPEEDSESEIRFVERLRPDFKFDSLEELKRQVRKDVDDARRVLSQR